MKKPTRRDLLKVNEYLKSQERDTYLTILSLVLNRYQQLAGPNPSLGYLRGRRFDLLYRWADSLSDQKYSDAKSLYLASQVTLLIKKYPWDPKEVNLDPEATALQSFWKSERKCARMNKKFRLLEVLRDPYPDRTEKLRGRIRSVIGSSPDVSKILSCCDFGQGASVGVHGVATHLGRKLTSDLSVTPCARDYVPSACIYNHSLSLAFMEHRGPYVCYDIETMIRNVYEKASVVSNNKISFVPKTAKTHRAIAVEPVLNGYLQKGTDLVLREKLRRNGINLSDQSVNCKMAREGSLCDDDESFVTIDLSSASDSISIGLAKHLLPSKWFSFLNRLRSPSFELDGKMYRYQKFCSMGNGFCFPLETLLFEAMCFACDCGCPGRDYHVYGDDIIVKKKFASSVLCLLRYYGFKPNKEKTFLEGPFRESCGTDWFNGLDVRPFTLDFKLDSLQSVFKFVNLSRRNSWYYLLFEESIRFIIDRVPIRFRFGRPFNGPPDSAFDPLDGIFFPDTNLHPTGYNRRLQCRSWYEVLSQSLYDTGDYPPWVVNAGLLYGYQSRGKGLFSLRRKTRAVVRLVSYAGGALAFS